MPEMEPSPIVPDFGVSTVENIGSNVCVYGDKATTGEVPTILVAHTLVGYCVILDVVVAVG